MYAWLTLVIAHSLQIFYYLPMSYNTRELIPIPELKLPLSTSSSVPWTLQRIINRTPFTATDLIPSSTHDTSPNQFIKELSPSPNPPGMSLPPLVLYASIPTKISTRVCPYATWISTTGSNLRFNFHLRILIILCPLHGRPQERVVSHSHSLLVRWIKWRGGGGEKLCVDLDLEWNSTFNTYVVEFPFERNFIAPARQYIDSSLAMADSFADIYFVCAS